MNGEALTVWSVALLTLLGAAVVIGAVLARRHGWRSRGGMFAVLALVAFLACLVWLGPALFLAIEL